MIVTINKTVRLTEGQLSALKQLWDSFAFYGNDTSISLDKRTGGALNKKGLVTGNDTISPRPRWLGSQLTPMGAVVLMEAISQQRENT